MDKKNQVAPDQNFLELKKLIRGKSHRDIVQDAKLSKVVLQKIKNEYKILHEYECFSEWKKTEQELKNIQENNKRWDFIIDLKHDIEKSNK